VRIKNSDFALNATGLRPMLTSAAEQYSASNTELAEPRSMTAHQLCNVTHASRINTSSDLKLSPLHQVENKSCHPNR
jgi:hypothetical protein